MINNVNQMPLPVRMQEDLQSSIPVLPNNGNPAGANNMPHTPEVKAPTLPSVPKPHYPWLEASPSVGRIRQMLDARGRLFNKMETVMDEAAPNVILPQRNNGRY